MDKKRIDYLFTKHEEEFGCNIISSLNPDETVALGAGILAAMKAKNEKFDDYYINFAKDHKLGLDMSYWEKIKMTGL